MILLTYHNINGLAMLPFDTQLQAEQYAEEIGAEHYNIYLKVWSK